MAKVITIAQQKGGAGKTTLAAHLAVALSDRKFRVAAIDIDPQGSLSTWHKIREEKYGVGYSGMTFSTVSGWRVGSEVTRLRKEHDFVIIDSPPHTETEAKTAIRNADLILIPVQPSPTDLWATKPTYDLAKAEKVDVRILLNRVSVNSRLAQAISPLLPELMETVIGNRVLFPTSMMEGFTATEIEPNSPAGLEIKSLIKEILALCKDEKKDNGDRYVYTKRPELETA
jgi:chromosome partitioning protein